MTVKILKRVSSMWNRTETVRIENELGGKFIRDDEGSYFEGSSKEVTVVTKRYIKNLVWREFPIISEEEGNPNGGLQYKQFKFDETVFNTVEIKIDEEELEVADLPQYIVIYNNELYEVNAWDVRNGTVCLVKRFSDYYEKWGDYCLNKGSKVNNIPVLNSLLE